MKRAGVIVGKGGSYKRLLEREENVGPDGCFLECIIIEVWRHKILGGSEFVRNLTLII